MTPNCTQTRASRHSSVWSRFLTGAARLVACAIILTWTLLHAIAFAQVEPVADQCPSSPPPYQYLRFDEDYFYLHNPLCRTDAFDSWKYIPLGEDEKKYLSLGGEIRQDGEYFNNARWGQVGPGAAYSVQSGPYSLQRYVFSTDWHLGQVLRIYFQVKSGLEFGRNGGPRPMIDEDKFAVANLFGDIRLYQNGKNKVRLRVGRQEMGFGATRYVSAREGPNVRQSFDGFRVDVLTHDWSISGFGVRPVETNEGVFDDHDFPGQNFWGVYATHPKLALRSNVDIYYLGFQRDPAKFQQGTADENRQSFGTRFWSGPKVWDYDVESIVQFGTFGSGDIFAWSTEADVGRNFEHAPLKPRLGVRSGIASGDKNPKDPNLETFNPLFPRGLYHQLVNLNGHVNYIEVDPVIKFYPTPKMRWTLDCDMFWRESLNDGVYGVGGNLIRPSYISGLVSSQARYLGTQPNAIMNWDVQRHFTAVFIYTHFFPSAFLHQTGAAKPVDYVSAWLDFKF